MGMRPVDEELAPQRDCLDRDGRLDVVAAAERGSNELRWWRNLGPA